MDSSHFPLFHSGQVFHQLVCPLTVVLPQIVFRLATLFCYPVFCSLFHAPLAGFVHFLVFRSSFRLESFLSQFSPFLAQIKNFSMDPVLSHHTSQERQPAAVPELPSNKPHQSPKQSHSEDHTEQIEATSREDHHRRTGRLQSRKEYHRADLQPTHSL